MREKKMRNRIASIFFSTIFFSNPEQLDLLELTPPRTVVPQSVLHRYDRSFRQSPMRHLPRT